MSSKRIGRRARTLAALLKSPPDLWLLARMAGWAVVLPALKFLVPLPRLVGLVLPRRRGASSVDDGRIERLTRLLYGNGILRFGENCLERSLVTFRYLAAENADPRLVVGMRDDNGRFVGHTWVLVNGLPVHDSPELLQGLTPVVTFTAKGERLSADGSTTGR